MNTQLEKLFIRHNLSKKDRYDFLQIFSLLSDYKKVKAVECFDEIVGKISLLKQDLHMEQEILFGQTFKNIEVTLGKLKKKQVLSGTKEEISLLRNMI